MAIIKDYITPQGVNGRYHKIIKAEILVSEAMLETLVAIYASAEAREEGRTPLFHEYVRVPFSALTQDPRDLLYPLVVYYGSSYLKGGLTDAEGSAEPGNFSINLKPEAIEPPAPVVQEPAVAPVMTPIVDPVIPIPTPEPVPVDPAPAPAPEPAPADPTPPVLDQPPVVVPENVAPLPEPIVPTPDPIIPNAVPETGV